MPSTKPATIHLDEDWTVDGRQAHAGHHNNHKQAKSPCILVEVSKVSKVWHHKTAFPVQRQTGAPSITDRVLLISPIPMPKRRHASVPAYLLRLPSQTIWTLVWTCPCETGVLQSRTSLSTHRTIRHSWHPATDYLAWSLCPLPRVLLRRGRRSCYSTFSLSQTEPTLQTTQPS